jgi:hypothetical protein
MRTERRTADHPEYWGLALLTMADEPEQPWQPQGIKFPITPRTLPKLMRLGLALRRAERTQDLDAEIPKTVMFDERSTALIERARDLAADEREDRDAVRELQGVARGHRHELRVAALGTRQWNAYREASLDNLAYRLLQAAIDHTPVASISNEERVRLAQLDAFTDLPHAEQWQVLVGREPRLGQLEEDAKAGQFRAHDVLGLPEERRGAAAGENLRGMRRLHERLDPLVGLEASSDDVILTSHVARQVAGNHLLSIGEHRHPTGSD